jgi:hypothetical protein
VEPKVNDSKFAPMTASLITRKGFAAPSLVAGPAAAMLWENTTWSTAGRSGPPDHRPGVPVERAEAPFAKPPSEPARNTPAEAAAAPEKPRRIMVLVTASEIERLGIAAIKKGKTRHEIVREALDDYLVRLARELTEPCSCLYRR